MSVSYQNYGDYSTASRPGTDSRHYMRSMTPQTYKPIQGDTNTLYKNTPARDALNFTYGRNLNSNSDFETNKIQTPYSRYLGYDAGQQRNTSTTPVRRTLDYA